MEDKKWEKKLQKYLSKLDARLKIIPYSKRQGLISELKNQIYRQISEEKHLGIDPDNIVSRYRNIEVIAKGILEKNGYPIKDSKMSSFKVILGIIILFFIIFFIVITFFIKSFFPIFDFDDLSGDLKLFGGKISLEEELEKSNFQGRIIINGKEYKLEDLKDPKDENKIDLKGTLPVTGLKSFFLKLQKGKVKIQSGDKELEYKCNTINPPPNFILIKDSALILELSEDVDCQLKVPISFPFKLEMQHGDITLENLKQDFDLKLVQGEVIWNQENKSYYNITNQMLQRPDLEWESPPLAPYKGKISIMAGSFLMK